MRNENTGRNPEENKAPELEKIADKISDQPGQHAGTHEGSPTGSRGDHRRRKSGKTSIGGSRTNKK